MSHSTTTNKSLILSKEFLVTLLRRLHARGLTWEMGLILMSVIAGLAALVRFPAPLRAVPIFLFLLICPGTALVRLFKLQDAISELSIGIALSLALDTLVGSVMVYTNNWSPGLGMLVLIAIALAAAGWQIYTTLRN